MELIVYDDCFNYFNVIEDESVSLCLTDPPYQIGYVDNIAKGSYKQRGLDKEVKPIKNDSKGDIDWEEFFTQSYRVLKDRKMLYMCCRLDMIVEIAEHIKRSKFRYAHDFVWHKGDMGYGNLNIMGTTHELIIALSKGSPEKSRIIYVDEKPKKRTPAFYKGKLKKGEYYGHTTQKPVGMMAYIIQNRTDVGDLVLDSFAGVGSTLVAAKLLGRDYIGIDIDEENCNKINQRLKNEEHLNMYRKMFEKGLTFEGGSVSYSIDKPIKSFTPAYLEWVESTMTPNRYGTHLQNLITEESSVSENDEFEIKVSYIKEYKKYSFLQIRSWERKSCVLIAIDKKYDHHIFYLGPDEIEYEIPLVGGKAHSVDDKSNPPEYLRPPNSGQHWDRWVKRYLVKGGTENLKTVIYKNGTKGTNPDQTTIFI